MTAILFTLTVTALLVYALERNHRRTITLAAGPTGSTNTENRDLPRMTTDLHAIATHHQHHAPHAA